MRRYILTVLYDKTLQPVDPVQYIIVNDQQPFEYMNCFHPVGWINDPAAAQSINAREVTEEGEYGDDRYFFNNESINYATAVATKTATRKPNDQIYNQIWPSIKAKRDETSSGGVLVAGKWFEGDQDSKIDQMGLLMYGANMPTGIQWKTMDNSMIEMTPQLAQAIFAAQGSLATETFANAEIHRNALLAAATPETYDWSTGWPQVYADTLQTA
jgi:hypothetical protein